MNEQPPSAFCSNLWWGMFVCLCVVRASAAVFFCTPARPRIASSPDVYNAYGENMVHVKDSLADVYKNLYAQSTFFISSVAHVHVRVL